MLLELTLLRFAWMFNFDYANFTFAGVIWVIGWSMAILGALVFLPVSAVAGIGVAIIAGHNAMAPLVAEFGLRFCFVFLSISALSFLGLGIQPPTADWGSMVRDTATLITFGDITPLLPAGAIALLTVAVNFVVDWQLHRASGLKD